MESAAAEQFREGNLKRASGRQPPGRYSDKMRSLALEHLSLVRQVGGTTSRAARDLHLDASTLRSWAELSRKQRAKTKEEPSALVPVEIRPQPVPVQATKRPYIVQSPSGYRVECSDVEATVDLLRALA